MEHPLFLERTAASRDTLRFQVDETALRSVHLIVMAMEKERFLAISELIAIDSLALSCAAEIVSRSYVRDQVSDNMRLPAEKQAAVLRDFSDNVLEAAKTGALLRVANTTSV